MEIFRDYAKFYDLLYQDKSYDKEARFVYNWANKPKKILELGIGTGQHAKYWCKKAKIIGIDKSEEMIKEAYQHPNIKYFVHPIEYLEDFPYYRLNHIDCVVALFNVMGYCLLEECLPYLPLQEGGCFIFDIWDAAKFSNQPPQLKVKYFNYSYRVSIPKRISKRLIQIDFIIVEDEEIKVFESHFVQGYFKKDIEQLCKLYNYKIVGIKRTKTWQIWFKLQRR